MLKELDLHFARPKIEKKKPVRNLVEKRNLAQTFAVIFLSTVLMIFVPKIFGGTNEEYSLFITSLISLFVEIIALMYVVAIAFSKEIRSNELIKSLKSVSLAYIAFAAVMTIVKILLIIIL